MKLIHDSPNCELLCFVFFVFVWNARKNLIENWNNWEFKYGQLGWNAIVLAVVMSWLGMVWPGPGLLPSINSSYCLLRPGIKE